MATKRPVCKYGAECYRKNPDHLKSYYHPSKADEESKVKLKQSTLPTDPSETQTKLIPKGTSDGGKVTDPRSSIKEKFLVDMPQDFYDFWDFCKVLNPVAPEEALKDTIGLKLVGPYCVLAGYLSTASWEDCVVESRYFYDTPEVLTVLENIPKNGYHISYYRDNPDDLPTFLVSNNSKESCVLKAEGDNIFATVGLQISKKLKTVSTNSKLKELNTKLQAKCKELSYNLVESKNFKTRNKQVVAKSFNKIGIVVPVDQNDVGYRPLPMTNGELKAVLDKIVSSKSKEEKATASEPLEEMLSFVQFANDECDYGMGLELGIDLFCHSDQFHKIIVNLLPLAYELLNRPVFAKIIKQHLIKRKKD
ncbi:histone PARylation factor 1-like [Dysidea avara]|uniref:histone PARylation factor 1-like n=1 Tax=Dysidea avara TaxID=196820 RepID=UPI00332560C4